MGLLDGEIKDIVTGAIGPLMLDIVVVRPNTGQYNPQTQEFEGGGEPIENRCKGFVSDYTDRERESDHIREQDRKIIIIAGTLDMGPFSQELLDSSPEVFNETKEFFFTRVLLMQSEIITPEGVTFQVKRVSADPAKATWNIQGRA